MTDRIARFVFVRHGEAVDAAGRCIGHTDVRLSPQGAAAMRHLVAQTDPPHHGHSDTTHLFSSDLLRAMESAQIISTAIGIPIELDARLREMNFGVWDGRTWAEIEQEDSARLNNWMKRWSETSTPKGESVQDVLQRVTSWLDEIAPMASRDRRIIIVSHAGWIRAALTHLLGYEITQMFDIAINHALATIVDITDAGPVLIASNISSLREAIGDEPYLP